MISTLRRLGFSSALFALLSAPALAFGIGLQPTTVEMEIKPSERKRQVITLANVHTEQTISLTLGLADWSLDESGRIKLAPPAEAANSAADWVRFSPAFVTLEPGEVGQVVVDMAAPARLQRAGDYRFALLASTILPDLDADEAGVWKKYQIATLFYLTTDPARSEPEITASEVLIDETTGAAAVELTIENRGNAHARLEGVVEVDGGGVDQTVTIANLVVLDGARRVYSAPLPPGTAADSTIEVKLDNIFAPQSGGVQALPDHRAPIARRRAALEPAE